MNPPLGRIRKGSEPFSVEIRWGSESTREDMKDDEPCFYKFSTQAELDAFLEGVEAACGWMDYEVVEPSCLDIIDGVSSGDEDAL